MKSYNHLFEKLIDKGNIALAIKKASKRKKKRPDVKMIYENPEPYIDKIIDLLVNDKFKPQTHELSKICDGSSKKERLIIQPYFYKNQYKEEVFEQIIHHAVIQVLEPIIMKGMYHYSCGSVPKRGGHYGKKYITKYIREHNDKEVKYCCKLDIRHFYENIDTDILKEKFKRIIHDERMLKIIYVMLDSNTAFYGDIIMTKGLRIGTYFAQWFANFFLQELDHYIKEDLHIKCYVRYVDDMILFAPNKKRLHNDFRKIKEFVGNYRLEVKSNWQIFKFDFTNKTGDNIGRPLDFMGFKFYRDKITLRKSILKSSRRKAIKIAKNNKISAYSSGQILSYIGWYKSTNTYNFFKREIISRINIKKCKNAISTRQKIKNKGV